MSRKKLNLIGLGFLVAACLLVFGCGDNDSSDLLTEGWSIAKNVYTTAEQQILPVAIPADTTQIRPDEVSLYAKYGYSDWEIGSGLAYDKRTDLAPD